MQQAHKVLRFNARCAYVKKHQKYKPAIFYLLRIEVINNLRKG